MPSHPEVKTFTSSYHGISKKHYAHTSFELKGPCRVLKLYSKYLFSDDLLEFGSLSWIPPFLWIFVCILSLIDCLFFSGSGNLYWTSKTTTFSKVIILIIEKSAKKKKHYIYIHIYFTQVGVPIIQYKNTRKVQSASKHTYSTESKRVARFRFIYVISLNYNEWCKCTSLYILLVSIIC